MCKTLLTIILLPDCRVAHYLPIVRFLDLALLFLIYTIWCLPPLPQFRQEAQFTPISTTKRASTSSTATKMKAKVNGHQAHEARFAEADKAMVKVKEVKSVGPIVELDNTSGLKPYNSFMEWERETARVDELQACKKTIDDLKKFSENFKLGTPVPNDILLLMTTDPAKQHEIKVKADKHAKKAQQDKGKSAKIESDPIILTPLRILKPLNIVVPVFNTNSGTAHTRDAALRHNFFNIEAVPFDTSLLHKAVGDDNDKTHRFFEKHRMSERPNKLLILFPAVPPPPFPSEQPTQLPAYRFAEILTFTGHYSPRASSSKPSDGALAETECLAQTLTTRAAQAFHRMRKLRAADPLAIDLRRSERRARIEPEFRGLEDTRVESLRDGPVWFDGADDSDGSLKGDEHESMRESVPVPAEWPKGPLSLRSIPRTNVTRAPAASKPAQIPAARDISFSTRPSRAAARAASAAISVSQYRGRGRGRSGTTASMPSLTGSPPPPPLPPPPPPSRPSGRSSGHNKTWGFTTGPGGPWIEPPVIDDHMFDRLSLRKNLNKDVKEAIAQLGLNDPVHDPHAFSVIQKQERMYTMRVQSTTGQWPTSNVRGAVDWEEVQKMRLGVAVGAALRQAEEEEREERLTEQRKADMEGKKSDKGERSSKPKNQVTKAERASDGKGFDTAQANSGLKEKDGNDEDATIVDKISQTDDDDAGSLHDGHLDAIPRSFNDGSTLRGTAVRKTKLASPRILKALPADGTNRPSYAHVEIPQERRPSFAKTKEAAADVDQAHDDPRRHPNIPLSFNEDFALRRAAEREARSERILRDIEDVQARVAESTLALASHEARFRQLYMSRSFHEDFRPFGSEAQFSASATTTIHASPSLAAPFPRPECTQALPDAFPRLHEIAGHLMDDMDSIASSDPCRAAGDGSPVRTHDFEYRNLVASGQIGGAAETRAPRPARGPHVGNDEATQSQERYNTRLMDLMERRLGLQLERPPPAGEAFPAMTGLWPQLPAALMDDVDPFQGFRAQRGAGDFGPFSEGPSGSGSGSRQDHQPPRSQ